MVIDNVLRFNSTLRAAASSGPKFLPRAFAAISRYVGQISRHVGQLVCGMHGHSILMHFEPNKLSLQCALCGYESSGWEVGRPMISRRKLESRVHNHHVRPERRQSLHAVPTNARLAS
jgi:hypothetical protein